MNNQKEIEKSFSVIVGKVLDFVDDKVNNATSYDKKALKDNIYLVRDNLIKDIKATENYNDTTENYDYDV